MTKTPLVTQDQLEEMLRAWNGNPTKPSGFVMVEDQMLDQHRWVTVHERVFRTPEGRFFSFYYETPNTEMQEGSESTVDPSDVFEVIPEEVVTVVYKPKQEPVAETPAPVADDFDRGALPSARMTW